MIEHSEAQDDKDFRKWTGEDNPEDEYDDYADVEVDQERRHSETWIHK